MTKIERVRALLAAGTSHRWRGIGGSVTHDRSEQPIAVCCMPAGRGSADAALIAEMRNNFPAALAVIESAERTLASFAAGEPDCQGLQEAIAAWEALP